MFLVDYDASFSIPIDSPILPQVPTGLIQGEVATIEQPFPLISQRLVAFQILWAEAQLLSQVPHVVCGPEQVAVVVFIIVGVPAKAQPTPSDLGLISVPLT